MTKTASSLGIATVLLYLGTAQAATVAEVFTGDMLGTNQRYFESIAGIPRESNGNDHKFKVQGCNVTATIEGGNVTRLKLETGPKCPADLTKFVDSFAPAPGKILTFGAFDESSGGDFVYSADCLSMCGNAYEPSVYALWEGPHAVNYMQVLLEVSLVSDEAIAASDAWKDQIVKVKGEDFVTETTFNCDPQFTSGAKKAFASVPVTAVTIGTGLSSPSC